MENFHFSTDRLDIIKKYEGLRLKSYDDATGKDIDKMADLQGTLRIGYGVKNDVSLTIIFPAGTTINENQANIWLARAVAKCAIAVKKHLSHIELNQNQFDALVLLIFNAGESAIAPGKKIRKALDAGEYEKAADAFLLWDKINNIPNATLKARREEERAIFLQFPTPAIADIFDDLE